jgi:tRNA nucleotidyltransferase/poly(A) polymerase
MAPDEKTLQAIQAAAPQLKTLSRERVWKELAKLLCAPDPAESWMLMLQHHVDENV